MVYDVGKGEEQESQRESQWPCYRHLQKRRQERVSRKNETVGFSEGSSFVSMNFLFWRVNNSCNLPTFEEENTALS